MRRFYAIIAAILLLVFFLGSIVLADSPMETIPVTPPPPEPVTVELDPLDTQAIVVEAASDDCTTAPDLGFVYDSILQVGGITDVSGYSTAASDPVLACMSGSPPNPKGYRSAWYQFVAPADGHIIIKAATNTDYKRNYDTAIAIYRDDSLTANTCSDLVAVGCNDDSNGFLSEAKAQVVAGETYLVEVVDRNLAAPGQVLLNLEAILEPSPSWEAVANPLINPLTRHSVVISGTFAYVLGGEFFSQRNGNARRYDTTTNSWTNLAFFPAGQTPNGSGYENTDAIIVKDEIHFPTGGVGVTSEFDGTHWVYDITEDSWLTMSQLGGPLLNWGATAAGKPVGYNQLVSFESGTQTGFYVVGGLTGPFLGDPSQVNPTTTFYRFLDTGISKSWQLTLLQMTRPRYAHVAERIGNFICVVGGLSVDAGTNVIITDGECYDENSGVWLPNIADMNTPRYLAGSAVGPGGQWVVFGGLNAQGEYVSTIEVYDFDDGEWLEFAPQFNIDSPPLAWPRGDFVNNTLWLFGGEQQGAIPVSLVQKKEFPSPTISISATDTIHMPVINNQFSFPEDSPERATIITPNISVQGTFDGVGDVYELYLFNWDGGQYTITLSNIPSGSDYDFLLYNTNKTFLAAGQNIGQANENLTGDLPEGSYYLIVARSAPPPSQPPDGQPFTLLVSKP